MCAVSSLSEKTVEFVSCSEPALCVTLNLELLAGWDRQDSEVPFWEWEETASKYDLILRLRFLGDRDVFLAIFKL